MTTDSTPESISISVQQPAVQALAHLIAEHPTLPGAYITVHDLHELYPGRLDLQFMRAWEFETWREALNIPASDVSLAFSSTNSWIAARTTIADVTVEISGFGIHLTLADVTAPRENTEDAA
ncbi:hypothetical protein ACIPPM_21940 [Streptomyces sp. NPDC090119]|uniref:hypothetical protein n=1 Tax=Streptomyces sp. NPDC090119 TaxID=3365951 RepID=UPI0037FCA45B